MAMGTVGQPLPIKREASFSKEGDEDKTEVVNMNHRKEIKRVLSTVENPGTFAWDSELRPTAPALDVKGVGKVTLPLSAGDADALRGVAELAPFGHGKDTKVDESVRRAWQIDGANVGIDDAFTRAIGKHALRSAEKLGLNATFLGVEARLYKLVM